MAKRMIAAAPVPRKRKSTSSRKPKRPSFTKATARSELRIVTATHHEVPLRTRDEKSFQRAAMQWAYIVRNRRRWSGRESLVNEQAQRAQRLLKEEFDLDTAALKQLAEAQIAQVVVPYTVEEVGWEARVFPWEYVITAATRPFRRGSALTVVRRLDVAGRTVHPSSKLKSILYVESAPGLLGKEYSFETERALLEAAVSAGGIAWHAMKNPTRSELAQRITRLRPTIVHLTGFDTHQGLSLVEANKPAANGKAAAPSFDLQPGRKDGFLLDGESGGVDAVDAETLGHIIGQTHPALVTCNLWNSSSRIAPMLVAGGAEAAIGIQDSLEDDLTETFFARLYRHWRESDWNLTDAFTAAWADVRQQSKIAPGSGIALWSGAPLVVTQPRASRTGAGLKKDLDAEARLVIDPARHDPSEVVAITVKVADELNYSLLHNDRPIFEDLTLVKRKPGRLRDVQVVVDLHAGELSFPYRRSFDLTTDRLDLRNEVHAPLTASLLRSVRESVHSSLFVEVSWGDAVLYRNTHRVRLMPVDQWRDSDQDRIWLPCFVLPRDAAVASLIDKAQSYVRVLRDDPSAGFDGYQSVDDSAEDPTGDVDLQVQAIWSAILHDWRLGYINPPPTYSKGLDSQRLRTPSTILSTRSGTCIDLTLLLASCLELVDIYPVVFLLQGHAFPGYWRSDAARDEFLKMQEARIGAVADPKGTIVAGTDAEAWIWGRLGYEEIVRQVDQGHLVPIESVKLTEHCGFWEAVEAGRENLRPKKEFHSMVDVQSARIEGVTPLPLVEPVS